MTVFETLIAVLAAIVLFLYALRGFSRELQQAGGDRLRSWLGRVTANRWRAFAVGGLAAAIVQSSTAVTSLAVALVDSGVITFGASLAVMLGSHIGSTLTVWLVSFKLTGIGPLFIVLGTIVSMLPERYSMFGKAAFYFGLVFFTLELIGNEMRPLQDNPLLIEWLQLASIPVLGVLVGVIATVVLQSSAVTAGLAIVLVQQGLIGAEAAIPIALGANVGTASTALIASLTMSPAARMAGIANIGFNIVGATLFLPFIPSFAKAVIAASPTPAIAVAAAHLIFNVIVSTLFMLFLPRIQALLERRIGRRVRMAAMNP